MEGYKMAFAAVVVLIVLMGISLVLLKAIEGNINGVYPELFGFCLEGIFFVILFDQFRKWDEGKRQIKAKAVLRDSLCHFIQDYVWWATMGLVKNEDIVTVQTNGKKFMVPITDQAKSAIIELDKGMAVPPGMLEPIQKYGRKELQMLKCLLPLTAELNSESLKKWFRIIQVFDDLVECNEEKKINNFLKIFLEAVVEFIEVDLKNT